MPRDKHLLEGILAVLRNLAGQAGGRVAVKLVHPPVGSFEMPGEYDRRGQLGYRGFRISNRSSKCPVKSMTGYLAGCVAIRSKVR